MLQVQVEGSPQAMGERLARLARDGIDQIDVESLKSRLTTQLYRPLDVGRVVVPLKHF